MPAPRFSAALEGALEKAEGIVFLCSGNMVRSAFAELYARHRGLSLPVRSGATTYRNDRIYPEAGQALLQRGIPLDVVEAFRPTHVDELQVPWDRFVTFGMTTGHLDAIAHRSGLSAEAFLLGELEGAPREIADPVLEGADFGATFASIERCVDVLTERCAER